MAFKLDAYEAADVDEAKIKGTIQFLKDLHIGLPGMLEMKTGFVTDLREFIEKEAQTSNPESAGKISGWESEIAAAQTDIANIQRQQVEVLKKIERLQNLLTLPAQDKKVLTIPGSDEGTKREELSHLLNAIKNRRTQPITFEEKLVLDDMIEKLEGAKNKFDNDGTFARVQIVLSKPELSYLSMLPRYGERLDAYAILLEIEEQMVAEQNRLRESKSKTNVVFTHPLRMLRELKTDLLTQTEDLPLLHTNDPNHVMESATGLLHQLYENVVEKEEILHPFKKFLGEAKNKVKDWVREHIYNSVVPADSQFRTSAISTSYAMHRKASSFRQNQARVNSAPLPSAASAAASLSDPPSSETGKRQKL